MYAAAAQAGLSVAGAMATDTTVVMPEKQHYGGSEEELNKLRNRNSDRVDKNAEAAEQSIRLQSNSVGLANRVGTLGDDLQKRGNRIFARTEGLENQGDYRMRLGIRTQDQALDLNRNAALGKAPSEAQNLLLSATGRNNQAMVAAASNARGGNQAAAYRAAMGEANAANTQATLDAATLRAREMADARAAFTAGANTQMTTGQSIANQAMQRQQFALGMNQAGIDANTRNAQLIQQAGANIANTATTREGNYLETEGNTNNAQLQADINYDTRRQAAEQLEIDKKNAQTSAMLNGGAQGLSSMGGMM